MKPMAREMSNRGPKFIPAFELKKVILDDPEQPSVRKTQSEPDLTLLILPIAPSTKPNPQQQPTPPPATSPKLTKAEKDLDRAVDETWVSESNFDPVNLSSLYDLKDGTRFHDIEVEGCTTVLPAKCPRPRGIKDFKKDTCSQIQHPGVNSCVQPIKLKKKIKNIKIKKNKTITTTKGHCCAKPTHQFIAATELNASVGTQAHKWGVVATQNNGHGMVCGSPPPTNDAMSFAHMDVPCQGRSALQECLFGETGTNIFCWFFVDFPIGGFYKTL